MIVIVGVVPLGPGHGDDVVVDLEIVDQSIGAAVAGPDAPVAGRNGVLVILSRIKMDYYSW